MPELTASAKSMMPEVRPVQPVVETRNLFSGRREIWIDHGGVRYRLRITRRNKLILQK